MSKSGRTDAAGKRREPRMLTLRRHKGSVAVISVVVAMVVVVLTVSSVGLYRKNQMYKHQEAELQQQIEKEKERSEEVAAYEEYVKTDDYIRDVAEDKLNLTDPNEIIFKPAE